MMGAATENARLPSMCVYLIAVYFTRIGVLGLCHGIVHDVIVSSSCLLQIKRRVWWTRSYQTATVLKQP